MDKVYQKIKTIGLIIAAVAVIAAFIAIDWLWGNWTLRYKAQLDQFFGEGNWETVSDDVKLSRVYRVRTSRSYDGSTSRPGSYREWDILCKNNQGQEEIWTISNHVYNINKEKHSIFSPKRYKERQALTLELMDISHIVVEEEVHKDIVEEILTPEEAHCITVDMSYHGGNPEGAFYDKLAAEPWFTMDKVTAGNFLATGLHEFYLLFRIHDYRFRQLSEEEQKNVVESLPEIEKRMIQVYGDYASFEILYDDFHVEYENGKKN